MFTANISKDTEGFRNIPVNFRFHLDTVGSSFWTEIPKEKNEAFGDLLAKWAKKLATSDKRIASRIEEAVLDAENEENYGETIYLKVGAFAVGIYARCGHWRIATAGRNVKQDKFLLAINAFLLNIESE